MLVDQIEQIPGTGELHPPETNEVHGQQRRDCPEDKGAEDAVAQRFALLVFREAETSTASTIALSALSRPSSATSSAIVMKSDGWTNAVC